MSMRGFSISPLAYASPRQAQRFFTTSVTTWPGATSEASPERKVTWAFSDGMRTRTDCWFTLSTIASTRCFWSDVAEPSVNPNSSARACMTWARSRVRLASLALALGDDVLEISVGGHRSSPRSAAWAPALGCAAKRTDHPAGGVDSPLPRSRDPAGENPAGFGVGAAVGLKLPRVSPFSRDRRQAIEPKSWPSARCSPRGGAAPSSPRGAPGGDQATKKLVRRRPLFGGQRGEPAMAGRRKLLHSRASFHG